MTIQAGSAIPSTVSELLLNASPATKAVVGILAVLSLVSWAVMLAKWLEFRRAQAASADFLSEFEKCSRLEQALALAKKSKPNAYARVVHRAATFLGSPGTELEFAL